MTIHAFGDKVPRFGPDAFVQVDATVVGDVMPEEGVTVRPSAAQSRRYPPRGLLVGSPAKAMREPTDMEIERLTWVRGRQSSSCPAPESSPFRRWAQARRGA